MPQTKLNITSARECLQDFRFADLFIDVLGWNNPSRRAPFVVADEDGVQWQAQEISQAGGFRVYEVWPLAADVGFPNAKNQQAIWKRLSELSAENIAIFVDARSDAKRTQSLWYWMKRAGQRLLPRRHTYIKEQPADLFLSKLAALVIDSAELDTEGDTSIAAAVDKVRSALDVETVTKVFFREFKEVHDEFLTLIEGIADESDRRWYASVLLNRLMFIWFLQKKFFLDGGDADYLRRKYDAVVQAASGDFFSHLLRDLFFEGFAKPADKRRPVGSLPLGDIPYLNGGLFLPHGIEARTEGDALLTGPFTRIRIPDAAFDKVFTLFQAYSWNLNDTPGGDSKEINPDVLGYIFEKYINQKEFGAYYTRPEITEYLCEQTIHQLVLDAAAKHDAARRTAAHQGLKIPLPSQKFESLNDLLVRADRSLCHLLLTETLPRLSLLDPACGSGAFLVAALKTLLTIYTGLFGRAEILGEERILQWRERERSQHKAPFTYWLKKKIITENLFGVDIMEEAVEIAKLRLFLTLVASATKRDELEPLPNIEFNLLPGNSLIGLLHVDPAKFEAGNQTGRKAGGGVGGDQGRMDLVHVAGATELGMTVESKVAPTVKEKVGAHLATKRTQKYDELLKRKNRLVADYKIAGQWAASNERRTEFKALIGNLDEIQALDEEAIPILNKQLLEEFAGLGIQFEQATWDQEGGKEGKPRKRPLQIDDITALQPFHWPWMFSEIVVERGGFDAIITNPPWEVFQTSEKEFSQRYEKTIKKNSIRIEDWDKQFTSLMTKIDFREDWLEYASSFPHVAKFLKNAPQYKNQIPIIDGRQAATKLNLFKNFLEQAIHLLRDQGLCGIIIPSSIYTDRGATQLRRQLFGTTRVTGVFGFENRKVIFEGVHRSFKFVLLSFQKHGVTTEFPIAFMRRDVDDLITFPSEQSLRIDISTIRKLSPDTLSMMEFDSLDDIKISSKLLKYPLLGDNVPGAWRINLAQEFNMTSDKGVFKQTNTASRMPLYEGKMINQFKHHLTQPRYWIEQLEGRQKVLGRTEDNNQILAYQGYRLGHRRIARNTDTRTAIATVVPPNAFCGDTVQTVRENLPSSVTLFLVAVLNSFAVDWMLRLKVTTHCDMHFMYSLPVPRLTKHDPAFHPLVERAARLVGTTAEFDDLLKEVFGFDATHQTHGVTDEAARLTLRAEIDARVAQLYDLNEEEFAHILSTFPLVKADVKNRTLDTFRALLPSADDTAVARIVAEGETDKVEFKEAAAYSRQARSKQPGMVTKVLQEIAAFLNTAGGSVLIGVDDAGQVTGLADDFSAANPNKPTQDGYSLYLRDAMSNRLDALLTQTCEITFHQIGGQEVCRILVPAAPRPVYLDQGELFIRTGTMSRSLRAQDAVTYVFQHWGT